LVREAAVEVLDDRNVAAVSFLVFDSSDEIKMFNFLSNVGGAGLISAFINVYQTTGGFGLTSGSSDELII
jgi:hypothetical protein